MNQTRMTMLRNFGMLLAGAGSLAAPVAGQMHKVAKPETVVRAVGVYEWTGDLPKPTASRLIPITLYIDRHLEDAGLYLARPVPFALLSGFVYELDESGVPKGELDLAYARHLQATNNAEAYDDGWFGYGSFKPPVMPKKQPTRKLTPARTAGIETNGGNPVVADLDPDKPHFVNKAGQPITPASAGGGTASQADASRSDTGKKADSTAPATDPDRPHFSKKDDASATSTDTKTDGTKDPSTTADADRPTMKRRSGNDTANQSSTTASTTSAPADDPDRPTLKRRSPEDAKKKSKGESEASVTGVGSLNDDPDRPNLHRGKPTSALTEAELPKLSGLPADLRQMVAVSDATNRPVHDFTRPWEDDAERSAVLSKMQSMALAQLAAYAAGTPAAAAPPRNQQQPGPTASAARLRR